MTLASRDTDLLQTLTTRVRLLTAKQIADTWWTNGRRDLRATRRVRALCRADLLQERVVLAEPFLALTEPVATWAPGQANPDYHAIAWRLQRRWTETAQETVVFIATDLAADTVGGVAARLPTLGQETHDLHVSQVYLRMRRERPQLAAYWLGEEIVRPTRTDEKLPDALIVDPAGNPVRVIEFGGRYDHKRVAAFHLDCQSRGLPYELW